MSQSSLDHTRSRRDHLNIDHTSGARTCIDCGAEYTLTDGQIDWYIHQKNLALPRRCKPCLLERRNRNQDGGAVPRSR